MEISIANAVAVLATTPATLNALLRDLPDDFTLCCEGPDTWSPFDIVGHFIHGERTDWIPRMQNILNHGPDREFTPFDRFAQFDASQGLDLSQLLDEFTRLRGENLGALKSLELSEEDFQRPGRHPDFGEVNLGQLLAAWVVHDLDHLAQISRVMAKQLAAATGPWQAFLPILKSC